MAPPAGWPCPAPGCTAQTFSSEGRLATHLRKHDLDTQQAAYASGRLPRVVLPCRHCRALYATVLTHEKHCPYNAAGIHSAKTLRAGLPKTPSAAAYALAADTGVASIGVTRAHSSPSAHAASDVTLRPPPRSSSAVDRTAAHDAPSPLRSVPRTSGSLAQAVASDTRAAQKHMTPVRPAMATTPMEAHAHEATLHAVAHAATMGSSVLVASAAGAAQLISDEDMAAINIALEAMPTQGSDNNDGNLADDLLAAGGRDSPLPADTRAALARTSSGAVAHFGQRTSIASPKAAAAPATSALSRGGSDPVDMKRTSNHAQPPPTRTSQRLSAPVAPASDGLAMPATRRVAQVGDSARSRSPSPPSTHAAPPSPVLLRRTMTTIATPDGRATPPADSIQHGDAASVAAPQAAVAVEDEQSVRTQVLNEAQVDDVDDVVDPPVPDLHAPVAAPLHPLGPVGMHIAPRRPAPHPLALGENEEERLDGNNGARERKHFAHAEVQVKRRGSAVSPIELAMHGRLLRKCPREFVTRFIEFARPFFARYAAASHVGDHVTMHTAMLDILSIRALFSVTQVAAAVMCASKMLSGFAVCCVMRYRRMARLSPTLMCMVALSVVTTTRFCVALLPR